MKAGRDLECSPIVAGDSLPRRLRESLPIKNPADETVLGSLIWASLADVGDALAVAESVRRLWRQCPALERGAILERAASLMRSRIKENAELLTLEQGKTLAESEIEWERGCIPGWPLASSASPPRNCSTSLHSYPSCGAAMARPSDFLLMIQRLSRWNRYWPAPWLALSPPLCHPTARLWQVSDGLPATRTQLLRN